METVLPVFAGVVRELEARLWRRSLLVEEEPQPELEAAVGDVASKVEAAVRACR